MVASFRKFSQVFASFCKFLQGFALFIFSFRVFWFCFFLFIFKIFLLIYFISALCENRTLTSWHFARKPTRTFSAFRDCFGILQEAFAISEFARTRTLTLETWDFVYFFLLDFLFFHFFHLLIFLTFILFYLFLTSSTLCDFSGTFSGLCKNI